MFGTVFSALMKVKRKKDTIPMERLEVELVRETIFTLCEEYLSSPYEVLTIEVKPNALDATMTCLQSPKFEEKYEFQQETEVLFKVKMRELNIM